MELVNEEMDEMSGAYQREIDSIENEIAGINQKLERLYNAIETGNVDLSDLGPRIRELRSRQEKLMARRAEIQVLSSDRQVQLANPEIVATYVDDMYTLLNESSIAERRAFVKSFIKDVRVKDDQIVLTYTIPLSPKGASQETMGVLSTIQDGGRYWI